MTDETCRACFGKGSIEFMYGGTELQDHRPCTHCGGTGKVTGDEPVVVGSAGVAYAKVGIDLSDPVDFEFRPFKLPVPATKSLLDTPGVKFRVFDRVGTDRGTFDTVAAAKDAAERYITGSEGALGVTWVRVGHQLLSDTKLRDDGDRPSGSWRIVAVITPDTFPQPSGPLPPADGTNYKVSPDGTTCTATPNAPAPVGEIRNVGGVNDYFDGVIQRLEWHPAMSADADERRQCVLWVGSRGLLDMIRMAATPTPEYVTRPVLTGLPDNVRVHSVRHDWERGQIGFVLEHPDFVPVPEGETIPRFGGPFGIAYEAVRVARDRSDKE